MTPKKCKERQKTIYRFYRRPTFISGLATLFDLYNARNHQNIYFSFSDDFKLISNDFKAAGVDIHDSLEKYYTKNNVLKKKRDLNYSY